MIAALALTVAVASTPAPATSAEPVPQRIDITKVQPKKLLPKTKLHTEFVVEVNRLGQVTRVRSGKNSVDHAYNYQTYGNALQAYIRTPDGRAIAGVYRLTYDYDPKTARIRRDVALVHPGGVNANAKGAALELMAIAAKQNKAIPKPHIGTPVPGTSAAPTVQASRLPDLNGVMQATPRPR